MRVGTVLNIRCIEILDGPFHRLNRFWTQKELSMSIKLSVLDYVGVDEGSSPTVALQEMNRLAATAESHGYEHYWFAEHHGYASVVSNAPEILMARLASTTQRLQIGSGGVMLPNYSSYKVAEVFRTMDAFAPGRINLGVGRATGAEGIITRALNDEKPSLFPYERKVSDLLGFLGAPHAASSEYSGMQAHPISQTRPLPWVLGASGNTAGLAAREGIGFNFAHFINPSQRGPTAAAQYRETFKPSVFLHEPRVMVSVFVAVADTQELADKLGHALHLWLILGQTREPNTVIPSIETAQSLTLTTKEEALLERNQARVLVGTGEEVYGQLKHLSELYGTNRIMVNPFVPGVENRVRSLELLAQAAKSAA